MMVEKNETTRKRLQRGSVTKHRQSWLGLWREKGGRRSRILGLRSEMSKSEARAALTEILRDVLSQRQDTQTLSDFIERSFFPVFTRRWKPSTCSTTKNRIEAHILTAFASRTLAELTREELQTFLDAKAAAGLSHSVVKHLRWDLNQIFSLANSEGIIQSNPAKMLWVPEARRGERKVMTAREVALMLFALSPCDALVVKLATLSAMRPGEIFGLQWKHYQGTHVIVEQRMYRGALDTPKTQKSTRLAAISNSTREAFETWRATLPQSNPDDWVFPSETSTTPETPWNIFRRSIRPALAKAGLGWVTFQVMRRTHASLMRELGQDAKGTADQLGHTLDVDLNIYTQTSVEYRGVALEKLEAEIGEKLPLV